MAGDAIFVGEHHQVGALSQAVVGEGDTRVGIGRDVHQDHAATLVVAVQPLPQHAAVEVEKLHPGTHQGQAIGEVLGQPANGLEAADEYALGLADTRHDIAPVLAAELLGEGSQRFDFLVQVGDQIFRLLDPFDQRRVEQ